MFFNSKYLCHTRTHMFLTLLPVSEKGTAQVAQEMGNTETQKPAHLVPKSLPSPFLLHRGFYRALCPLSSFFASQAITGYPLWTGYILGTGVGMGSRPKLTPAPSERNEGPRNTLISCYFRHISHYFTMTWPLTPGLEQSSCLSLQSSRVYITISHREPASWLQSTATL